MKPVRILAMVLALAAGRDAIASEHLVWMKDGKHNATYELGPGKFIEVCANLAIGDRYDWKFEATAALNFNIHYHIDELVGRPAILERVQQGSSVFEARSKQDYCWTWVNRSKESLKVIVQIVKSGG